MVLENRTLVLSDFFSITKRYNLLKNAVVDIAPGLKATTKAMPVSINGTLKSIASLRSEVTLSEVNVKSARFSKSSATRPFHLF